MMECIMTGLSQWQQKSARHEDAEHRDKHLGDDMIPINFGGWKMVRRLGGPGLEFAASH